jgi:serine/threonine protein kinase
MTNFEQRLRETLSDTYDIERELGGGGMSRVFVATDRALGRKVVIKLLSPELTADVNRARFHREIQVAARLQHPHIVALLSAGEHEDFVYYTMPFISGDSLKQTLEKTGALPIVETVRVLYHVSEALDYAHGEGVVHRDIKPANILRSGTYSLVTDFGVAKAINAAMPSAGMTSTGMAIGTPAYMAPEQLAGDASADHRIDIYALGLLAYELLHGKSPFKGETPQRVLAAVLTQDPQPLIEVRPDVPRRLSEIVMRCLSKEPEERPASARELLDELDVFSTASGEIRTMEHKLPRRTPTTATPVTPSSAMAAQDDITRVTEPIAAVGVADDGYAPPPKSRKKLVAGAFAVLIPLAAAAIYMTQQTGTASLVDTAAVADSLPAIADSLSLQPATVATVDSAPVAVVPVIDSQAIRDSVRKAARAEAAKKAAARNDSIRRIQEAATLTRTSARQAASAMLSNPDAVRAFERGATRMGGPLNTRRRGDLQTQIDALTPYLTNVGLSYDQFKAVVAESGVGLFDEFGRMLPDALRRFASGG